jgi:hypothetical protein
MDLTDSYRIFHTIATEYTFFSVAHGTFSKMCYVVEHKESLTNTRKLKQIPVFCQITWNKTR